MPSPHWDPLVVETNDLKTDLKKKDWKYLRMTRPVYNSWYDIAHAVREIVQLLVPFETCKTKIIWASLHYFYPSSLSQSGATQTM